MPIQFTCPHCFKKTLIDDKYAGQQGPCAGCGKTVAIPIARQQPGMPAAESTTPLASSAIVPGKKTDTRRQQIRKLSVAFLAAVGILLASFAAWKIVSTIGSSSFIQQIQERSNRAHCMNHLGQIARALNAYADKHGKYPPPFTRDADGKPLHSWRTLILEELGEHHLHNQIRFDEPWDSEHNQSVFGTHTPRLLVSPARDDASYTIMTSYFLVLGDGTIFPKDSEPLARDQILDRLDRTLLVVEADNQQHEWYKPIDIEARDWTGTSGSVAMGGTHPGGFTAAFADGTPAWIPDNTPPDIIRALITAQGGEHVDRGLFVAP